MQWWQPKILCIYKMRMEEQCCTLAPPVSQRDPSGSSLWCPRQSRRVTSRITRRTRFLSIFTLELSCCCFTATSAPILAQTLLLEPSNISQWVMCTFRPLQKTLMCREEEIYLCFPRTALAERLRNNRLWPQEDTNPTFTRVLRY